MRILLLSDYSGFHLNLKKGLEQLGHTVFVASNGDGFKKLESDISLGSSKPGFIGKISRLGTPFFKYRELIGYDVIQFVNSNSLTVFAANKYLYDLLVKENNIKSLSACGDDLVYYNNMIDFDYYPYKVVSPEEGENKFSYSNLHQKLHKQIVDKVDMIIPTGYDYAYGYKKIKEKKTTDTVPLPLFLGKRGEENKIQNNKVSFLHGINREFFKGTYFIKKALEKLKDKYPSDVDVNIVGNLPLTEYLELLQKTNVIIDQCKTYGYGMNALHAMANNKFLMTSCRKEYLEDAGILKSECPIIHIEPNINMIYNKLCEILESKINIPYVSDNSRTYVEKYHDAELIAKKYEQLWQK